MATDRDMNWAAARRPVGRSIQPSALPPPSSGYYSSTRGSGNGLRYPPVLRGSRPRCWLFARPPIRALLPPASESSPVKLLNIMWRYESHPLGCLLPCAQRKAFITAHYVKQRPLPSRPLLAGSGPPGPGPAQKVAPALSHRPMIVQWACDVCAVGGRQQRPDGRGSVRRFIATGVVAV